MDRKSLSIEIKMMENGERPEGFIRARDLVKSNRLRWIIERPSLATLLNYGS